MKNQVIEALTPEHGAEVIEYWKSRGVDTRNLVGNSCKSRGSTFRYYGVIKGRFNGYRLAEVEEANAEIIELPETNGYVFHVPTHELQKAVQLRLFKLNYNWPLTPNQLISIDTMTCIYAESSGDMYWCDHSGKHSKSYDRGSLDELFYTNKYKLPKKVMELTMQEIAEKFGVDEVKIKE